jgi:ABC-type transport system involved in multi-copper enzyme maturation permease subunit
MGLTLLSVGSLSLLVSILCRRTWTAVTISYVAASMPFWCCGLTGISYLFSPIGFLAHLEAMPEGPTIESTVDALTGFTAIHGLISLACVGWAMFLLRPSLGRSAAMPRVEHRLDEPKTLPFLLEYDLPGDHPTLALDVINERRAAMESLPPPLPIGHPSRVVLPRVNNKPLLWKELNLGQSAEWLVLTDLWWLYFTVLVLFLSMACLLTLGSGDEESQLRSTLAGATFALVGMLGICLAIAAGLRAAASVSREREQRTLESLCSIPVSRPEILQVKWFGSLWRYRRTLIGLGVLFALAGFCGVRLVPLALLLGTVTAHVVFAVSLGIFLSVLSRTTLRAYLSWALVMIAILAGSLLLGEFINERTQEVFGVPSDRLRLLLNQSLNPLAAWLHLMNDATRGRNEPASPLFADLFGIQVYLLAAAVLCLTANRRFRREGERD